MEGCDAARQLTIHLFRPGTIDVMRAETCLHMAYGNLLIESGKCGSRRRCGVAMNQHHIGMYLLQHLAHTQ